MRRSWPGMYRSTTITLVVLVAAAGMFSAVGWMGFSPEGIYTTAVIAVLSTLIASAVGARLQAATLHWESSVITGLLIALIVPPTLEPRDLLGTSAAGVLAGLSKWALAPSGRHFLNPAATGVAVASLMNLTVGFWWVAAPPMLPLLLAGGLIVAWRAGHLLVGLGFVTLASTLTLVRLVVAGEPLGQSVWLVASSYPIIFLGLFMLTEPLTLPPRLWQQSLVVAITSLGVAFPFTVSLGSETVSSSPELALVVGNLLAASLLLAPPTPRSVAVALESRVDLTDTVSEWSFVATRPLRLEAGQWIELQLPHHKADGRGIRRVFSVSSAPSASRGQPPRLSIATRLSDSSSSFKRTLGDLTPGAMARVVQVGGDFLPPIEDRTPLVFVSRGIGITPFVSALRHRASLAQPGPVTLIHIDRVDEAPLYPELDDFPGVVVHRIASLDDLASLLPHVVSSVKGAWWGVSGSPSFVRNASGLLRRAGVKSVHTDRFIGY